VLAVLYRVLHSVALNPVQIVRQEVRHVSSNLSASRHRIGWK